MKSGNITNTDGRLLQAYQNVNRIVNSEKQKQVVEEVKKQIEDSKIQVGTAVKFYPYLDKVEVKSKDGNVLCKVLHRYWGELRDFFTPEGERDFDDKLKEPCVIPRSTIPCVYADINDGTNEHILLGYYADKEILYVSPAEPGIAKITSIGARNNYSVEFGNRKFSVFTENGLEVQEGYGEEVNTVDYYTKKDVDRMFEDLRKELNEGANENAED